MSMKKINVDEKDFYPIRHVCEKTGVNAITLRAWERRYNLIRPQRTSKGHRLYTEEDISLIKRILGLLNVGYSIGEVSQKIKNYGEHQLVTHQNINQLVCFKTLSLALKSGNYIKVSKEIDTLISLYSITVFAQLIFPEMIKFLSTNIFTKMLNSEVMYNQVLDHIMWRLYTNIYSNSKIGVKKISIVGFQTSNMKILLIHGLFIASIFSSHGYEVNFCSNLNDECTLRRLLENEIPTVIFTSGNIYSYYRFSDLFENSIGTKYLSMLQNNLQVEGKFILQNDYTKIYEQFRELSDD